METAINTISASNNNDPHNLTNRNTLTFAEAWDEIFERAISATSCMPNAELAAYLT